MHRGHAVGIILDHARKLPSAMTTFAKSHADPVEWRAVEAIVAKYVGIVYVPQTHHHSSNAPSGLAVGVTKPKPKPTPHATSPKPTSSKRKAVSPVSERTHELLVGLFAGGSPITPSPVKTSRHGGGG